MNTDLMKLNFERHELSVFMIDGEPWFSAREACAILEFTNFTMALGRVDSDDKRSLDKGLSNAYNFSNEGGYSLVLVNEAGLYQLVLGSRKPEARKFKRWITHEVLPSIRRTGRYEMAPPVDPDEQALALARQVTRLIEEKRALQIQSLAQSEQLAVATPKVEAWDALMNADGYYSMAAAAQMLGIGRQRLFETLRALHIMQPMPIRRPYQPYVDNGYFIVKAVPIRNIDAVETQTFVTPKGLDWLRRKLATPLIPQKQQAAGMALPQPVPEANASESETR